MALQLRRGTDAERQAMTPLEGELIYVVDYDSVGTSPLWIGDGATAGGLNALAPLNIAANTATNLAGGATGSIPYQTASSSTSFIPIGAVGSILASDGTTATWQTLASLSSGAGVNADNVFVNTPTAGDRYIVLADDNGTYIAVEADKGAAAPVYNIQSGLKVRSTLTIGGNIIPDTDGIYNIGGPSARFATLYLTTSTIDLGGETLTAFNNVLYLNSTEIITTATIGNYQSSTATNLAGGTAGQIAYQTGPGLTSFAGPGTAGQILVSAGASAPVYTNTGSIYVGNAVVADSVNSANTATQQVGFAATAGSLLEANTGSTYVGFANKSNNVVGGTAGQLVYQSGVDTTAFAGPGTAGQILVSAGASAPTYTNTGSIYVGNAATANVLNAGNTSTQQVGYAANVLAGAAGSIVYQTAANATGMLGISSTDGAILVSNGSNAPQYATWTTAFTTGTGSTAVATNQSLRVTGGGIGVVGDSFFKNNVGIDGTLNVTGAVTFSSPVTFNGTATYVLSTNTLYTDNILELHVHPGGVNTQWQVDDGKDIGFRFHYYTASTDTNAALVLANDTKFLEWYSSGAEGTSTFAGSTYGTFKTGNLILTDTAGTTNATSGAIQVAGGVGVGGNLYVAGVITATTFVGAVSGTASSANNISGGTAGQLVYQTGVGATGFAGPGTAGQILVSAGASAPTYTNTGSIYVGNAAVANILNSGNTSTQQVGYSANLLAGAAGSIPYQSGANATTYLSIGTNGYVLSSNGTAPTWTPLSGLSAGQATTATNLAGGTAGQLAYQTAAGATSFAGPGTAGQILVSAGASAPTYTNTGSIYVGNAATANVLNAGNTSTQQVGFAATAGALLAGNTGTTYVGFANKSNNVIGGTAGQLLYNSAADTTGFVGPGTAGNVLVSNGTSAPTYNNTITLTGTTNATSTQTGAFQVRGGAGIGLDLYVGGSLTVGNPSGGSITGLAGLTSTVITVIGTTPTNSTITGALQVAGGIGIGGSGFFGGIVTATTFVGALTGTASAATNVAGGTAGQLVYQTGAGATSFAGPGTAGQILVSAGTSAPTYTNTGSVYVGNAATANVLNAGNTATQQVGYAANVLAGAAGSLVYQSGANATGMLAIGAAGTYLTSTGSAPQWSTTSTGQIGYAANLLAGAAGSLHYQTAANATGMLAIGTAGQVLTAGASAPQWTSTGSLYVNRAVTADGITGGASVSGNLTVTGNLTVQGTTITVDSTVTNVSDPIFTIGSASGGAAPSADDNKDRGIAFQWHNGTTARTGFFGFDDSTGYFTFISSATFTNEVVAPNGGTTRGAVDVNLAGGTAGQLVYQSGADTTAFVGPGTAGQLLVSAGASAPTYTNTGSIYVGFANKSNNVIGGTAGQLLYNSAADTTGFVGPGTAGQILVSAGTSAPTYTNTGSIYVGNAATANVLNAGNTSTQQVGFAANVLAGAAGSLHYQTAANATGMLAIGAAGTYLTSSGTAPQWSTTSTGQIGYAANLLAGAAGSLPYQSGANATTQLSIGAANTILVSTGSAPSWVSTSSIYATKAANADKVDTVIATGNAVHYVTFVDSNNVTAATEINYTTSTFVVNPATGNVAIGTTSTTNKFQISGAYGQLFSVVDSFTGTVFAASDISGIPSIEVLDTGFVKIAQYGGTVAISTASTVTSSGSTMGLTVWTSTYLLSLGVGSTASGVVGEIRASNEITAYYSSDRRLKENVRLITDPITLVNQLNGVYFDWTDEHIERRGGEDGFFVRKDDVGVIAQEVEAVLPQLVADRPDGFKGVKYEKMIPLLIEAIKQQDKTINRLEEELREIKTRLSNLE